MRRLVLLAGLLASTIALAQFPSPAGARGERDFPVGEEKTPNPSPKGQRGIDATPPSPKASEPDFEKDVRPILAKECFSCHGASEQKAGLRFDRKTDAMKGGDSGPPIVPGKPADSLLIKRITSKDDDERMPLGGDPLGKDQIAILRRWMESGAKWPENDAPATPTGPPHWSFQPVVRPQIPTAGTDRSRNPIDAFLGMRLQAAGLTPNPEADSRTLIRRLKSDLLGLPPTPEEVDAFAADPSPAAYERLVNSYLASPHYGERWARHWLDVVRFAESNGFETNLTRPNAWPYRDWVIKSLNADKPYDQFVREQLAGDVLGSGVGTGYLVAGAWDGVKSPDITLTLQQRADELNDMIATTGSAFLGLTVGCARCHSHKFDPISQVDYHRLKAVFAGVQHGERTVREGSALHSAIGAARLRAEIQKLEARVLELEPLADPAATSPRRRAVSARLNIERFRPTVAKYVRFLVMETNSSSEPCIDELEVFTQGSQPENVALAKAGAVARSSGDFSAAPALHRLAFLNDGRYGNGRSWISNQMGRGRVEIKLAEPAIIDRIVWSRDRDGSFTDRVAIRYRIDVSADGQTWVVVASSDDRLPFASKEPPPMLSPGEGAEMAKVQSQIAELRVRLAILERGLSVYAGTFTAPEPTFRLNRGDPTDRREPVGPGVLGEIGPKLTMPETADNAARRLALANWITDPAHPLTSRVIVNRLWNYHFGAGIVDTPSDFGRNGSKPAHPELLDWLASELVHPAVAAAPGETLTPWSLKHIHRLIVTSTAYRRSSASTDAGKGADAQSRLLWRFPPRRLEAEPIRDAILFVSGRLDTRMGGPGFDLFEPNGNYVKVYKPKTTFGPDEFRRMIYQQKPRMQLDDTFGAFDCPDAGQIAPRRNVSTTPLQALNLLNSAFVLQQADYFAGRVEKEAGKERSAQVRHAFRLAFQRLPSDAEKAAAEKLVRDHGLPALCRALFNASEFVFVE